MHLMRSIVILMAVFIIEAAPPPAVIAEDSTGASPAPAQPSESGGGGLQSGGPAEAQKIVVATVNGVGITYDAVVRMMRRIMSTKAYAEAPRDMEDIRKEALDKLVVQELAYQKAKAEGTVVGEKAIDDAIADLRKKLGGDERFNAFLERESMTGERLRPAIERNLVLQAVSEKEVTGRVTVSGDDVRKEYEKDKDKYTIPEKVAVTDVIFFLKIEDEGSAKIVEGIRKKLEDQKDKDPWTLVPDGTFIVRDLEVAKDKEKDLYEAAKKLKVGELSGLVKTSDSLHLIKLTAFSPRQEVPFEAVKGTIEKKLRTKVLQERIKEWGNELKKGAKIEIMDAKSE